MPEEPFTPRQGARLARLTTLGVGGPAEYVASAGRIDDIVAAHRWASERGVRLQVLGGGSNVVVADAGLGGLLLRMAIRGLRFQDESGSTLAIVGAGEPWDEVVARAVERDLGGLECLSGIPGLAGGTPIQNVGAYGQEVASTIERVTVFDRSTGDTVALRGTDCGFAYRTSRFKGADADRFVVCEIGLRLRPEPPTIQYPDVAAYLREAGVSRPTLRQAREAVLAIRRRKGMVLDARDRDTRSVGSFFTNPVVTSAEHEAISSAAGTAAPGYPQADGRVKVPAAWLIERAGIGKGYALGRAGVSSKHPLALVNRGGASAREIVDLAVEIKRRVLDRFGISLRPEPVFLGFGADPDVEFLQSP